MLASAVIGGIAASLVCSAGVARADDVQAARAAYDRGAAAYDAREYTVATTELARADELTPNDVVLELALKAAAKGDDARLGMRLVLRAESRKPSGALAVAASAARDALATKVGTITPSCPGSAKCTATIDAGDVPVGQPTLVLVGTHRVVLVSDGGVREGFDARVDPTVNVEVKASAPRVVPPIGPKEASPVVASSGLSPTWFWIGLGVSAALGGVTIGSAVDTKNKHDDFLASPSNHRQDSGESAQLRTTVFAGVTAASAVATALLGAVFVQWSPPSTQSAGR